MYFNCKQATGLLYSFHRNQTKPNEGESGQSDINVWTLIVITFYVSVMFDLSVAAEALSKFL